MTEDPELAAALERAARYLGAKPRAALVRELVLRGTDQLEREEQARQEALGRLARMAVNREGLDWDVLERIEEIEAELEGLPPPVE